MFGRVQILAESAVLVEDVLRHLAPWVGALPRPAPAVMSAVAGILANVVVAVAVVAIAGDLGRMLMNIGACDTICCGAAEFEVRNRLGRGRPSPDLRSRFRGSC